NVSQLWLKRYFYFLIAIALIQIPVVIYQFSIIKWIDPDRMSGTFGWGQTGNLGIYFLTIFALLAARMAEIGRIRIRYIVFIALLSIPPVLGEVKLYFLFLPIIAAFLIRNEFYRRPGLGVGLAAFAVILIVSVDYIVVVTQGWQAGRNPLSFVQQIPEMFNREIELAETVGRYSRADRLVNSINFTRRNVKTILFGEGPGAITTISVFPDHSPKTAQYANWGLISESAMTFPWLLIEYGYVGVALFFYLLWLIYRRGTVLRSSPDQELRIYGRFLEASVFIYFTGIFYGSVVQVDSTSTTFWTTAALIVSLSYKYESEKSRTIKTEMAEAKPSSSNTAIV
ncbi:MAG: hypothetical protein ACOZB3_11185, partial [Calditrichota bacterium]